MKSRMLRGITAIVGLVALAMPVQLAAQQARYKLIDLGTFGGPNSFFPGPLPPAQDVNDRGTAMGGADTPVLDPFFPNCFGGGFGDCFVQHAFKWQNGVLTDLGVLPGGSSSFANQISASGRIVGVSQNGITDPLTDLPEVRAVAWTKGDQIIDLGTLPGGTESVALGVNSGGQTIGIGNNSATQGRALLWDDGVIKDLGTLGGLNAGAFFVNDRGQIAGISDKNSIPNPSTGIPTVHPFLWQNGEMEDLGSLGGLGTPSGFFNEGFSVEVNALNSRGEVAGTSPLVGDQMYHAFLWDRTLMDLGTLGGNNSRGFWVSNSGLVVGNADFSAESTAHHAFLWKNGVMSDLGTLGLCQNSTAFAVNSKGQAVGDTGRCPDGGGGPSFFSEHGQPMVDINSLVLPGSDIEVVDAIYINDLGEIAGGGILPNGDFHAVLLAPASAEEIAAANALDVSQSTPTTVHMYIKNSENSVPGDRNRVLNMLRHPRQLP